MNIYLQELKSYKKNTLIWSISLISLTLFMLCMYPSFSKESEAFSKILLNLPPAVTKSFSISLDSFFTFSGFYSYILLYIQLCGSIQAMNLGISVFSKEIEGKTSDFLLSMPISRNNLLKSKLMAILTCVLLTNIFYFISTFIFSSILKQNSIDFTLFFLLSSTVFLIQIIFLCLGLLLSLVISKIKSTLSLTLSIVFGLFFLSALGSNLGDTFIPYITPFKYFEGSYIIKNSAYQYRFLLLELIFIIISITSSFIIFNKKDIEIF